MKKQVNLLIMVLLAMLLSIGCAKKPTPAPVVEPPPEQPKPQQKMTQTEVKETASVAVSDLTRIYFDFDSYVLTGEARTTLQQNAALLKTAPMLKVQVEGHCDERGSDDYNLALGERRAQATVDYLVSLGVNAGQLSTISYGEMRPLDPGHNEMAWSKNRRAEFVAQ